MVHERIRNCPAAPLRGFSLIELLVVAGIFVVVSSIVLINYGQFGGRITLKSLAYDIALSVREAQVYGIAVRRTEDNLFSAGYGMHFLVESAGTQSHYELFADANNNGVYDGGELVRETTIGGGYRIASLIVRAGGSDISVTRLDVLFKRPEPDAYIYANGTNALQYELARVALQSPRGDQSTVTMESTGQISVE